MMTMQL